MMYDRAGYKNRSGTKVLWLALACLMAALLAGVACDRDGQGGEAVEWGYGGPGGPEHWASLAEDYAACSNGRQQSPIDITGYGRGDGTNISFSYSANAKAVHNDGKFVRVDYATGNTMSLGQRTYELKSGHLHSPSEHWIDGVGFSAELHLVHADADGDLAVVGVLFELGAPSPAVQTILDAAPAAGDTVADGFTLNARDYLPGGLGYYRYDGSKTTPPCDEPVDWHVMHQRETISAGQVDRLLELSGGPNNRPVHPTGGRLITTQ